MKSTFYYRFIYRLLSIILIISCVASPILAHAEKEEPETEWEKYQNEAEARKNNPVESNNIEGWPDGPAIGAEGAILMDADTGEILYAKNIDAKLYPASTTKLMTCLVAIENASLSDLVTINQSAIDANDRDGSNMGLYAGEQLTVEELLYGILINSANEACNALAEHISGDTASYVELMNAKAKELGCTNTHFVTTNGLTDPDHYTSAKDLAIIASEFFKHDIFCRISHIGMYDLPETSLHREHSLYSKNKLFKNRQYGYEYLIGSKTGYTTDARQTLVSGAEKDGVRLVCVILKEESPYQFEDTVNLFEYGFNNFSKVNVALNETKYQIGHTDFFDSENDLFGSSAPIISIDKSASLLIPNGTDFSALTSSISYDKNIDPYFGMIDYYYGSNYIGSAGIAFEDNQENMEYVTEEPDEATEISSKPEKETVENDDHIILDIKTVIKRIIIVIIAIIILVFALALLRQYLNNRKRMDRIRRRHNAQRSSFSLRRKNASRAKVKKRSTTDNGGFSKPRPRNHSYKPPMHTTLYDPDKNIRKEKERNSLSELNFKTNLSGPSKRPENKKRSLSDSGINMTRFK